MQSRMEEGCRWMDVRVRFGTSGSCPIRDVRFVSVSDLFLAQILCAFRILCQATYNRMMSSINAVLCASASMGRCWERCSSLLQLDSPNKSPTMLGTFLAKSNNIAMCLTIRIPGEGLY